MKNLFLILFLLKLCSTVAQVFQVDTLQYKGDSNKYINIVIMGDGYTAAQQTNFITDAATLSTYILQQAPWVNYKNYFNVFAIRVISAQSGAKHPNTASDCNTASPVVPVSNPATYFNCSFDAYGIHRLIVPQNNAAIAQVLAANFPNYDQVLIIANTAYYGGSGGNYATSTLHASSNEITAHETGHSFAQLADEYYAGDSYAGEKANMTQETNPQLVKWKNWMGYNGTGIYQHSGSANAALWYRPHNNCKMRYLNSPFCSVCSQAIVERIHNLVNPIVSYLPVASSISSANQFIDLKLTELMKPAPNTLKIKWTLDANIMANIIDSLHLDQSGLTLGSHTVVASVTDTTALLRVDNHSAIHLSSVTWTINKTTAGIKYTAADNKIDLSVYPNPAQHVLNIYVVLEKSSYLEIVVLNAEGRMVKTIENSFTNTRSYLNAVNLNGLPAGIYFIAFKIGGASYAEKFIKEN